MERRPGVRRHAAALASCLLATGCLGERAEERSPLPPGAPVGLSEAPILVVGERANVAEHEFHRVLAPFLLPDGGIGVPLASEGTIRLFDREGELVGSLGSTGQGPGEFMGLAAAWARGDTIEAFDDRLRRVTRFVPGETPETVLLETVASAQSGVPGLEDGSWVLYGVKEVHRTGRDLVAVHHFGRDGRHLAELGETHGFRRHVHDGGAGPDPLSPRPVVRTFGNRIYVAETLTPDIEIFDVSTGARTSLRWEPTEPLGHGDAVSVVRARTNDPADLTMGETWTLASLRALTGSEEVPVFWDFLVDGTGFVWVRPYDPGVHSPLVGNTMAMTAGPGGVWSVLDVTGRPVTSVAVPDDFAPVGIDADHLIGIRRDDFGVESARVYRIERSGP